MNKLLKIMVFLFLPTGIFANPLAMPHIMSEFYIANENEWYLEIYFDPIYDMTSGSGNSLDGMQIISSSGSSELRTGIIFNIGEVMVLTQDSLQNLVLFDRNCDFIQLYFENGGVYEQYSFGNHPNSQISALNEGQSLVQLRFSCYGNQDHTYFLCKDASPHIGDGPFTTVNATGTYSGKIFDINNDPIANIQIGNDYIEIPYYSCISAMTNYISTDNQGYFSTNEYSGRHTTSIFYFLSEVIPILDTIINLEPNTDNYFEFHLDTLFTGVNTNISKPELSFNAYPNPSKGTIYFSYDISNFPINSTALIKIFNQQGEIVKILPAKNTGNNNTIQWNGICDDKSIASGQYICKLELNNKSLAKTKLLLTR